MIAMHHDPGSSLRTQPTLLLRGHDWENGASWEEFDRLTQQLKAEVEKLRQQLG